MITYKIFLRFFTFFITLLICISFAACDLDSSKNEDETSDGIEPSSFYGGVLEVYDGRILVLPSERSAEWQSCGKSGIYVSTVVGGKNIAPEGLKKGSYVLITYNGMIAETHPPQIFFVYSIEIIPPPTSTDTDNVGEPINETLISCGNASIYAESFFLDSLIYIPTDDPEVFSATQGCGEGAYFALIEPDRVFPTIEKNGDVDISVSSGASLERIYIAKPDGENIEHTVISEDELNALPVGEYFIVLWKTYYGNSVGPNNEQGYTRYEDVFKLIVQ